MIVDFVILVLGLIFILGAAELFTNGIEAIGHKLNLSKNFTGSVLAAVGTALPETILPIIAVIFFAKNSGEDIGVGAILGAPFMLSTLAFPLIGITALVMVFLKRRKPGLEIEEIGLRRDIVFFLFAYSVAMFIIPYENHLLRIFTAIFLIGLYILYAFLTLRGESEEVEEVDGIYLSKGKDYPLWLAGVQVLISLVLMIGGAHLFVHGIEKVSLLLGFSPLLFSLLVAPIATELPEKVNSVLWIVRKKDSLAVGNVSGAMVFQSTIPVSFGIVFTDWNITGLAFVSGVFAIISSFLVLIFSYVNRKFLPVGMTAGILFFISYIYLVISQT